MKADINHQFKIGDRVVCVDGKGARLIKGQEYVIKHIDGNGGERGYVRVEGFDFGHFPARFRKVEEMEPVAKAGDLVSLREFPNDVGLPGWHEGMRAVVGQQFVAAPPVGWEGRPWLIVGDFYWPISHLDVVKQGEHVKKPAKKKVVKPKKVRVASLRSKLIKAANGENCCSFAIRYHKAGTDDLIYGTAPCHATFNYLHRKPIEIALYYTKQLHEYNDFSKNNDKKVFASYVNYCLNRSPFAEAFLTKKASEAYSRGIKANINQSSSMVAFGAITIRQATEHNGFLNAWEFARKNKFSEDASFFFAINHSLINDKWSFAGDRGHAVIGGSMDFAKCIKVFKDGLVKFPGAIGDGASYKINGSWYAGAGHWGRQDDVKESIESVLNKVGPMETIGEGFAQKISLTDASILKRLQHIESAIINVRKGK